ncbi:MAG: helix-turn-helix domain-containing protein [Verrucomicrobiota bacterium]|nr:helix-turn-helix domain-containing protein [Verrucomicrobiota bacterium]
MSSQTSAPSQASPPATGIGVSLATLIPEALFDQLRSEYGPPFANHLQVVSEGGAILWGKASASSCEFPEQCNPNCWLTVTESLRWGEVCVLPCPCDRASWAVPVVLNNRLLGALVVRGVKLERRGDSPGSLDKKILEGCNKLLLLATRYNLTNTALMELNRQTAANERVKAEAIHAWKQRFVDDMRALYLREEPELLAAIRRGERPAARGVINRVLVAIYSLGQDRVDLLKSYVLELVVMMGRAAVQGGATPELVFGLRFRSLAELDQITEVDEVGRWLTNMLEHLLDALGSHQKFPNTVQLGRALTHMEEHLADNLCREDAARVAGMSPSHFTRLLSEHTGHSFAEMLTLMRINRARERLLHSEEEISSIALSCGFADQSYFTRVFHKVTGQTPGDFRRQPKPSTAQK